MKTEHTPGEWRPIETAPKDGTRFLGKMSYVDVYRSGQTVRLTRVTWYGKASHIPLYGWCHGRVEDVDLWAPTHWRPITERTGGA